MKATLRLVFPKKLIEASAPTESIPREKDLLAM